MGKGNKSKANIQRNVDNLSSFIEGVSVKKGITQRELAYGILVALIEYLVQDIKEDKNNHLEIFQKYTEDSKTLNITNMNDAHHKYEGNVKKTSKLTIKSKGKKNTREDEENLEKTKLILYRLKLLQIFDFDESERVALVNGNVYNSDSDREGDNFIKDFIKHINNACVVRDNDPCVMNVEDMKFIFTSCINHKAFEKYIKNTMNTLLNISVNDEYQGLLDIIYQCGVSPILNRHMIIALIQNKNQETCLLVIKTVKPKMLGEIANYQIICLLVQNDFFDCIKPLKTYLDCVQRDGKTALHLAVEENQVKVVEFLLKSGVDVNKTTQDGDSALHIAVRKKNKEALAELLEFEKLQIDIKAQNGFTPLHTAAGEGSNMEVIRRLLDKRIELLFDREESSNTALHIAAGYGHKNNLIALIACSGQENAQKIINLQNDKNETPLFIASARGHHDIVKILLTHGADTSLSDSSGNTALHVAAISGHVQVVKQVLLSSTASKVANKKNTAGNTPLFCAITSREPGVITQLFPITSKVCEIKNNNEEGILHVAVASDDLASVECVLGLIKKSNLGNNIIKALLLKKNKAGKTLLHVAVHLKNFDILQLICKWMKEYCTRSEFQEIVNTKDCESKTPFDYINVLDPSEDDIRNFLKNKGAKNGCDIPEQKPYIPKMTYKSGGALVGLSIGLVLIVGMDCFIEGLFPGIFFNMYYSMISASVSIILLCICIGVGYYLGNQCHMENKEHQYKMNSVTASSVSLNQVIQELQATSFHGKV